MKLKPVLAAAVLSITAAGSLAVTVAPALAQTPLPMDEDPLSDRSKKRLDKMEKVVRELRSIVFQGRDTGKPVIVQPAETEARMQGLSDRLQDLEQTLQRMNGQNEVLTHELDLARKDAAAAKAEAAALDARLRKAEQGLTQMQAAPPAVPSGGFTAPAGSAAPPPVAVNDAGPDESFKRARQFLLDGDYDAAESAFGAYVERYGDGAKGAEARYWLGETQYVRGAYSDAAASYIGAIRGWPKTGWAPDAVLKLARTLVAMKRPADACKTLDQLVKQYPKAGDTIMARAGSVRAQAKCTA